MSYSFIYTEKGLETIEKIKGRIREELGIELTIAQVAGLALHKTKDVPSYEIMKLPAVERNRYNVTLRDQYAIELAKEKGLLKIGANLGTMILVLAWAMMSGENPSEREERDAASGLLFYANQSELKAARNGLLGFEAQMKKDAIASMTSLRERQENRRRKCPS